MIYRASAYLFSYHRALSVDEPPSPEDVQSRPKGWKDEAPIPCLHRHECPLEQGLLRTVLPHPGAGSADVPLSGQQ
jgi:hypothetical protein